jgi:hypothetical protein
VAALPLIETQLETSWPRPAKLTVTLAPPQLPSAANSETEADAQPVKTNAAMAISETDLNMKPPSGPFENRATRPKFRLL